MAGEEGESSAEGSWIRDGQGARTRGSQGRSQGRTVHGTGRGAMWMWGTCEVLLNCLRPSNTPPAFKKAPLRNSSLPKEKGSEFLSQHPWQPGTTM